MENLIEVKNLDIQYVTEAGVVHAVNGVSFSIGEASTLGLVGETGAGKTTTALGILNLVPDPPGKIVDGEILFRGQDLRKLHPAQMRAVRGSEISMIFQDPMTALNPVHTVGDQIAEVVQLHSGCTKAEAWLRAVEMLAKVGIMEERAHDYPHQFSGGMKQRVVIAIALACEPALLIGRTHHRPGCDHPGPGAGDDQQPQAREQHLHADDHPRSRHRGGDLRLRRNHVRR